MNRKYLIPALALGIAGISAFGVLGASAKDVVSPHQALVQKIAKKFNLKESDVQSVFDEDMKQHQAEMQQRIEARLDQAIKDGKLTDAQKQAILAKQQEMQKDHQANWQAFKDMTPTERQKAMEDKKAELEAWAKANGIDSQYLMGGGHGMRGHFGRM